MRKIILPILAAAGALILGGCSLYGGSQNSAPNNPAGSTAAPSTANAISIQNFAFNPSVTTIKKGTTITWTNNDSAPHQIKSASFNSSQLAKGQSFSFSFNDVGSFDYSCAIHPSMAGKIIVE